MANYVGKSVFTVRKNKFEDLDSIINGLKKAKETAESTIDAAAAEDAQYLARAFAENYSYHLERYGVMNDYLLDSAQELSDRERSNIKLNKYGSEEDHAWYGAPSIYVTKNKGSYTITLNGKDLWYQEFGTGTVGRKGRYPFKTALKYGINKPWEYVVGETIIQNYKYVNSSNAFGYTPSWYKTAVKNGTISKSDYVWKSPMGITKGEHAGKFIFSTLESYWNDFETGNPNIKLSKRTLSASFVRNFKKSIKKK